MPFAVTHVIVAIIIINFFRKRILGKENFPLYLVLIGGIAGLIPDLDYIAYWIVTLFTSLDASAIHGSFTHNLLIPAIFLVFGVLLWKWDKVADVFLVISAGYTIHVLLDAIFSTKPLFYPFSSQGLGLALIPNNYLLGFYMSLDAIVFVLWLIYEWKYKKIKDYS